MHRLLVDYFHDYFHRTRATFTSCNVLITPNETHPHDTLRMCQSVDSKGDHQHKETRAALLPLGMFVAKKSVSKEMIEIVRSECDNVNDSDLCEVDRKEKKKGKEEFQE